MLNARRRSRSGRIHLRNAGRCPGPCGPVRITRNPRSRPLSWRHDRHRRDTTDTRPDTAPTHPEPPAPPETNRHGTHDSFVLIALLATCAGIYLAVGDTGFAGVISAVAGLYGTWRTRR